MDQLENKFDQAAENKKDVFLAHMEEKYGVTFLPISYASGGYVTNEEFRCYAEGTDPERDYVSVFVREEDGEEVFYDDYFGILIRDDYQNRVEAICDGIVVDTKVYVYRYAVSFFDNQLTAGQTIEDAIAMGQRINASKYVFMEVAPGTEAAFEEACDRIADQLEADSYPGVVKFIGLAKGELANITSGNYLEYLPSMVKPDGTVCLMMAERVVSLA